MTITDGTAERTVMKAGELREAPPSSLVVTRDAQLWGELVGHQQEILGLVHGVLTPGGETVEAVEGVETPVSLQPPGSRGGGQVLSEDTRRLVNTLITPET